MYASTNMYCSGFSDNRVEILRRGGLLMETGYPVRKDDEGEYDVFKPYTEYVPAVDLIYIDADGRGSVRRGEKCQANPKLEYASKQCADLFSAMRFRTNLSMLHRLIHNEGLTWEKFDDIINQIVKYHRSEDTLEMLMTLNIDLRCFSHILRKHVTGLLDVLYLTDIHCLTGNVGMHVPHLLSTTVMCEEEGFAFSERVGAIESGKIVEAAKSSDGCAVFWYLGSASMVPTGPLDTMHRVHSNAVMYDRWQRALEHNYVFDRYAGMTPYFHGGGNASCHAILVPHSDITVGYYRYTPVGRRWGVVNESYTSCCVHMARVSHEILRECCMLIRRMVSYNGRRRQGGTSGVVSRIPFMGPWNVLRDEALRCKYGKHFLMFYHALIGGGGAPRSLLGLVSFILSVTKGLNISMDSAIGSLMIQTAEWRNRKGAVAMPPNNKGADIFSCVYSHPEWDNCLYVHKAYAKTQYIEANGGVYLY
jgi:hypothetical protein